MVKKRIVKPKFDEGSNTGIYRGTAEQHTNPNQLWERERPLDDIVVTPNGSYPNMQSYIAATHGSAYDQNAPFEMFNDFTSNAAPMLFDAVYQGVTGTYGTGNAKNPAQTGMGLLYKYTAPSRWLGSAKSLLPGYEFVAPWSDNNPGLTGDQNLDAVFDILVGKGFGESTRLENLKKNITNKIKTDFNKYIIPYRELQNANTVRSFLYNPIRFNKAYREKLKFQK